MSDQTIAMSGADELADETTPRDSEPALPDYEGEEDQEGEALLQQLAGSVHTDLKGAGK